MAGENGTSFDDFQSFINEFAEEAMLFGRPSLPIRFTVKEAGLRSSVSMEETTQPFRLPCPVSPLKIHQQQECQRKTMALPAITALPSTRERTSLASQDSSTRIFAPTLSSLKKSKTPIISSKKNFSKKEFSSTKAITPMTPLSKYYPPTTFSTSSMLPMIMNSSRPSMASGDSTSIFAPTISSLIKSKASIMSSSESLELNSSKKLLTPLIPSTSKLLAPTLSTARKSITSNFSLN